MTLKNLIRVNGLLLTSTLVVLMSSCDQTNNPNTNPADFQQMYSQTASTPQSFTINANVNTTITGVQGTIVNIPANSFETMGGAPVSGSVTFYLTEVYDNNEMVFNQRPTIAGTQVLVSGGVVNLAAYQGGNELALNNGIIVLMPTSNTTAVPDTNMQVFYWDRNDSTANPTDSTWVPADSALAPVDSAWTFDTVPSGPGWYYNLYVTELNWTNCDAYYSQGVIEPISADAPENYLDYNTKVYVILTSLNTFVELHSYSCSGYEFCTYPYDGLPVGFNYAVAAIHYDSGTSSYSSSIVSGLTVLGSGNVVTLNFSPTTIAQFEADVIAL